MMHKMVNGFSWSLFSCCGSHYSVFVLFFNSIFYAFDFFFFFTLSLFLKLHIISEDIMLVHFCLVIFGSLYTAV